ncbi:MAG TPA: NADH-quinone oxidoreductase subunit C [Acidobacteriaceae bacterium]|nr:NADH-quinone oxidoreductase subunit C [Acidobacteriaceae bacterium]
MESQAVKLPGNIPTRRLRVDRVQWLQTAKALRESDARFLTLWGADDRDRDGGFRIYAAYLLPHAVMVVEHFMENSPAPVYPSIAGFYPAALRMQRAVYDLLGISTDETDMRCWLRHGGWPEAIFPLRRDVDGNQQYPVASAPYPFVSVEGDGVHEIAVGPVHAGTIEPGHFRFSVVGEKVLRLEERLGYTHKGVAKLLENTSQQNGHRLAARVSGDSAVAFSWAYCAALESITDTICPARTLMLRALALEHERLANHLGDLGALGNDAGFAFGLTQFSKLKEDLLRTNIIAFGARYLLDYVIPGGVAVDLTADARSLLLDLYDALEPSVNQMRSIYDEHAGLQDRFREAGRLGQATAEKLGAMGLVGRASGIACDLRVDHPWTPYDTLAPKLSVQAGGDVAARVQVRFDESIESLRLCRTLLSGLTIEAIHTSVPVAAPDLLGIALIEAWRGPVMIALETGPNGGIRRCHAHDPSCQNWPLIEYAILGNIVPDFPLINKSFNLSYSGQDG